MVRPPPGCPRHEPPPIASVRPRATARPSPSPSPLGHVAQPLERREHRLLDPRRHPGTVVDDPQRHPVPAPPRPGTARAVIVDRRPRAGVCLSAFSTTLAITRSSRPASASAGGRSSPISDLDPVGVRRSAEGRPVTALPRSTSVEQRSDRARLQPAQVEQVADQGVQPVGRLLDGGQQLLLVLRRPGDRGVAQAADRGLDRGQRAAQVVRDRGQQRGPGPVALGQLGARCRDSAARPPPLPDHREVGRVRGEQALVGRLAAAGRGSARIDARRRSGPSRRPRSSVSGASPAAGLDPIRAVRPVAPDHAAPVMPNTSHGLLQQLDRSSPVCSSVGQDGEGVGLGPGPGGLLGPAGRPGRPPWPPRRR